MELSDRHPAARTPDTRRLQVRRSLPLPRRRRLDVFEGAVRVYPNPDVEQVLVRQVCRRRPMGFDSAACGTGILPGGQLFGRGYDTAELSGDNGVAGSVELRFDQKINAGALKAIQAYGFVDGGAVRDFHAGEKNRNTSLASAAAACGGFLRTISRPTSGWQSPHLPFARELLSRHACVLAGLEIFEDLSRASASGAADGGRHGAAALGGKPEEPIGTIE